MHFLRSGYGMSNLHLRTLKDISSVRLRSVSLHTLIIFICSWRRASSSGISPIRSSSFSVSMIIISSVVIISMMKLTFWSWETCVNLVFLSSSKTHNLSHRVLKSASNCSTVVARYETLFVSVIMSSAFLETFVMLAFLFLTALSND